MHLCFFFFYWALARMLCHMVTTVTSVTGNMGKLLLFILPISSHYCIVVAEFVHTTPLLSYTLCRVNYESCSLLAYFFAVDKTRHTLLPCKSIGKKVGVV